MAKTIIRSGSQVQVNEKRAINTTEDAISIGSNIVVDKPPVVDGPEVTGREHQELMRSASETDLDKIRNLTEADILTDAVVAVDMQMPSYLDVKPKDPIWAFRWVNRKHDSTGKLETKEGSNEKLEGGNRYEQFKSNNWCNVTPDECAGKLDSRLKYQDGAIVYQDVILMKINKATLFGIYKSNLIKANRTFSDSEVRKAAANKAQSELVSNMGNVGVKRNEYQGKVGIYIPDKIPGAV